MTTLTTTMPERLRRRRENETMALHLLAQAGNLEGQALLRLDTADPIGRPLAEVLAENASCSEALSTHKVATSKKGELQTVMALLPAEGLALVLQMSNLAVAKSIHEPAPVGGIFVAVVAASGSTLLVDSKPRMGIPRTVGSA